MITRNTGPVNESRTKPPVSEALPSSSEARPALADVLLRVERRGPEAL